MVHSPFARDCGKHPGKKITLLTLPELAGDILLQAFYQGILATIIQMLFYVKAVETLGPSSVGSLMAIVPLTAGLSAIFLLGEELTLALIVGLLLVSIGAGITHSHLFNTQGNNHALRKY